MATLAGASGDQRRDDRARLRNDPEIARARGLGEEARVETGAKARERRYNWAPTTRSPPPRGRHVEGLRPRSPRHVQSPAVMTIATAAPIVQACLATSTTPSGGTAMTTRSGRRRQVRQALAAFQFVDLDVPGIDEPRRVRWIGATQIGGTAAWPGSRARSSRPPERPTGGKTTCPDDSCSSLDSSHDARPGRTSSERSPLWGVEPRAPVLQKRQRVGRAFDRNQGIATGAQIMIAASRP